MCSDKKHHGLKLGFILFTTLLFFSLREISTAKTFPEIVKIVKEAVVKVSSKTEDRFGSGFFISRDGYLLTCAHVLKNDTAKTYEQEFTVQLFGEIYRIDELHAETTLMYSGPTKFNAEVDTVVEEFDLAILKANLKTAGLTQVAKLPIGQSGKMLEGYEIATCGFIPDGFTPPKPIVVKGIVSVIRKDVYDAKLKNRIDILQLDQQTAGGLSGAPVFSADFGVVGYMDAAILPDQRTKQSGFSYALAIDQVKNLLLKYIKMPDQKETK